MFKREWTTDVHKFQWDKILHYVILALSLEKEEEEADENKNNNKTQNFLRAKAMFMSKHKVGLWPNYRDNSRSLGCFLSRLLGL